MNKIRFLDSEIMLDVQLPQFIFFINELANEIGIDLSAFEIDHVSLRCNRLELGHQWLKSLIENGELASGNEVNGRSIYLINLFEPLILFAQKIRMVELPFPRKKQSPVEGWEHIELVCPFLEGETEEQWQERIIQQFHLRSNSNLVIKCNVPSAKDDNLRNLSISIRMAKKVNNCKDNNFYKHNYCCIKLHPYSLQNIICS